MAEARAVKFCTKGDYIRSCQRDDKSPLKGHGIAHMTNFCMRNCGLRKILNSTSLTEIYNIVDNGLLFIAPTAL